jgi:hypothetical protein
VLAVIVVLIAIASPASAWAWSSLGHETAGLIAATHLRPAAAGRVLELLGSESLAEASTWADRMRSDPAPFWQDEAGPYHYVTVPPGSSYEDAGAPPEGDAYTALAMFREELCNPRTDRDRQRLALRFALHIIQDLQQPLHVGNGRDRGGNDVPVTVAGDASNLHRIWDREILAHANLDRDALLARLRAGGRLKRQSVTADPLVWIRESAALRARLYPPPSTITATYLTRWLPTVEERVALAGLRSAAWLNETLEACGGGRPAMGALSGPDPGAAAITRR